MDILERSDGPCVMRFTGHSLGGLLAPAMALWLVDYLADAKKRRGDLKAKLALDVYGYAAPTAGNRAFAAYLESRLQNNKRFANDLDAATLAWDETTMRMLPSIYEPDVDMQPITKSLYNL